ncbi:uncharacterized protein MAL13P1.304-like [Cydia pomonella]|uniref:uncharacterized protein MAL13P1.304-like n=1 Tax=Cydia pomonella TaxID=82600 RepID=UPI002ADD3F8C|nr:uncharacterized protein MAL13P1.304-like [Cydia pomonella]
MVTAEDDDDSDNDLIIDEGPTANQGSTNQPQNTDTTGTGNELPSTEVDFLPLMRNVEILKNIPYIPDVSKKQIESKQTTAKIACRDFSRKPFGTNEMLHSALYHHLTTDNTMPPNQQHMGTSNDLRAAGNQNLKHLLDAPSRPPTNPYAPLPRVYTQTETFMTPQAQNVPRTQSNMNMYVQSDLRNQPNTNVYARDGRQMNGNQIPKAQTTPNLANEMSVIVPHPGNFTGGTITYEQTTNQRPANNLPITVNGYPVQNGSAPANQEAQISVYKHTETRTEYYGQTTMNYQVRPYRTCELACPLNLVPGTGAPMSMPPLNPEHQAMTTFNHHATNRGTLALNPGHQSMNPSSSPRHQSMNSTFKPHVTSQGVPGLNPEDVFMLMESSLNPQHQSMNSTSNPHVANGRALAAHNMNAINPGHESMIPSSSPYHQSMNSTFNPHDTSQGLPILNPGHELWNSSLSPQHTSMNPTFNPQATSRGALANPQHQSMNSLNSQPHLYSIHQHGMNLSMTSHQQSMTSQTLMNLQPTTGRAGDPINVSPIRHSSPLQHQNINPSLSPQSHSSRPSPPPCYSCTMGKPCGINPASSYLNGQPALPMPNSQAGAWNGYRQNYIRTGSMPQNPGYNNEQIEKAAYLAALRSQEYILQNATRDILGPPVPVNKKPRAPRKQRANPETKKNNVNATLAASLVRNEPINNDASTSTLPFCTPTQLYPLPNWAAFGTKDSVPKKTISKTTKIKISNAKKTQDRRVPLEKTPSLTLSNIEPHSTRDVIPYIDLTTDLSQKPNTNMTPNIIPAPLSKEIHKQTVNRRIDTSQKNVTAIAHNMNGINLMQDSSNVEGQLKPMTMNNKSNGTPTHLIEASTQQETSSKDINQSQINTEQPWIDIKSDGATIPLIMDQQYLSMENVESTIQPSVIQTTTKNVRSETFLQKASDSIDIETAMALLHADSDEVPANVTQNSKARAILTNAYELVSTSVTTETTSHNIESNDIIMRMNTSNSEVHTNQEVNIKQTIENTVTVSIVNKIITNPNISLPKTETLLDILNKVQQNSIKEAHIKEHMEETNTEDENKIKRTDTAVDHGSSKEMDEDDHKPKDIPDGKYDDRFKIARQNLARWSATEHDNESKRADHSAKPDTFNVYHIEVITGPHGQYIAQVKMSSPDGSSVQQEEFNINCSIGETTQIESADSSEYNIFPKLETKIEIHQATNDAAESEEIKNINNEESESAIDELIFFKFQINFFRLVQERLSENNHEVYAQKLHNAIHDLIILSDHEDATADLKYECHECHNVTMYSPRQLYYNGINYLKSLIKSAYNCQLCLTFKRKYIEVLIKYIKLETSGAHLNTSSKQIAENTKIDDQKPETKTYLINERQTDSKPALLNDESDSTNKKKDRNVKTTRNTKTTTKEQRCVKIVDAPLSSKQAEISNQKKHNNKNKQDSQNQSNFVVKLPRHKLKESTVEALIQCQNSKSNDNKSGGGENLNIALHKGSNKSSISGGKPTKETATTVTSTATVHSGRNISTSLANDNNKEKHHSKIQTINAEAASITSLEQQNINTNNSINIQDNKNQERCAGKRKRSSAEDAINLNPDTQNRNSNPSSNNNDTNLESHSKKKKIISDETNPELQKINAAVLSKNKDSDKNYKSQSKMRKSLSAETSHTIIPGTNTTSDKIDDQNKNQDQHSKKRKSICTTTATITSSDSQNSTSDDNDDKDKSHERPSNKRKSTSGDFACSELQNKNTNVSENNDNGHEGHSKRRKSISAESETRPNLNDCHDHYKNKERDRGKNNEEHETRQPNASKNISDEIATSKNGESQNRKTIGTSNNNSSNSNKEPCVSEINHAANNKKDNNEVRKSIDSETTTSKDTECPNDQDNLSNKNKNNDVATTCEARKSTNTDILSKKHSTTGRKATSTETTTNKHTQDEILPIILKIFRDRVESITRKNNNGEKQHNAVNTDDEKACDKSAQKLNTKEKDELPKVEIPGKKEEEGKNKAENKKKVIKAVKINYKYICKHCGYRYRNFTACEEHLTNDHKIVKIVQKEDYIKMITCPFCPEAMIEKALNKHLQDRHPDKRSRPINK